MPGFARMMMMSCKIVQGRARLVPEHLAALQLLRPQEKPLCLHIIGAVCPALSLCHADFMPVCISWVQQRCPLQMHVHYMQDCTGLLLPINCHTTLSFTVSQTNMQSQAHAAHHCYQQLLCPLHWAHNVDTASRNRIAPRTAHNVHTAPITSCKCMRQSA